MAQDKPHPDHPADPPNKPDDVPITTEGGGNGDPPPPPPPPSPPGVGDG